MAASARMRPAGRVDGAAEGRRRKSLRALRLEQIAIWGAAANAESRGGDTPFAERRASLWERDSRASGSLRNRDRAARRSLVLLDGDRPRRSAAPPPDDNVPARPTIVLEDSDDDNSSVSSADIEPVIPTKPAAPAADGNTAARERRALFAARAKSAVRADPQLADDSHPRARSFFEERRQPGAERSAFARARASIRLLGRYSRSGSARIPLFRPRPRNSTNNANAR